MKNFFKIRIEVNDDEVIKFKDDDIKTVKKKLGGLFKKFE